jgi:hypothetical protein
VSDCHLICWLVSMPSLVWEVPIILFAPVSLDHYPLLDQRLHPRHHVDNPTYLLGLHLLAGCVQGAAPLETPPASAQLSWGALKLPWQAVAAPHQHRAAAGMWARTSATRSLSRPAAGLL